MAYEELAALGLAGGVLAFGLLMVLALYIYTSVCLMVIAQKTNTNNAWLAWIPIANIFLMTSVAKQHWGLALAILVIGFIPLLNIVSVGLLVYVWWLISERRGKHGALSLLLLLPIVNLVYMGYLAFSK